MGAETSLGCVLATLMLIGCTRTQTKAIEGAATMAISAEVELDVFSGRPNPVWTLSNADTAELERRLSALTKTSATTLFDGLGYRGLIVRLGKDATAHVQNGIV